MSFPSTIWSCQFPQLGLSWVLIEVLNLEPNRACGWGFLQCWFHPLPARYQAYSLEILLINLFAQNLFLFWISAFVSLPTLAEWEYFYNSDNIIGEGYCPRNPSCTRGCVTDQWFSNFKCHWCCYFDLWMSRAMVMIMGKLLPSSMAVYLILDEHNLIYPVTFTIYPKLGHNPLVGSGPTDWELLG